MDLGMDATGCEWRTSFCPTMVSFLSNASLRPGPYPARIGIEKPPPNAVRPDLFHPATSIQKHSKHALAQINNLLVLLRVGRIGRIVSHGMLLGDRWDDERRMKSAECIAQRCEFGISPANLEILWL